MITPTQLRDRLNQSGIDRSLRVLTDWRQKGLLPPLRRVGLGRGKGSEQVWNDDVLDQAIAVHFLLSRYARTEEALLGLWLSGYSVNSESAQKAWMRHLELVRARRKKAASSLKGNFLGLGEKWWRQLPEYLRDRSSTQDILIETPEWLYDDTERDDEGYRSLLTEFISGLKERMPPKEVIPSQGFYDFVNTVWDVLDIPAIFRTNQSIEFIESMSKSELNAAHESLSEIRQMIQHGIDVLDAAVDRVSSVLIQVRLMQGLIGPFVAMVLVQLDRAHTDLPLADTISTIHSFAMGVKSSDISQQSDGSILCSQRVISEWETVKENLVQMWGPIQEA